MEQPLEGYIKGGTNPDMDPLQQPSSQLLVPK